MADLAGQSVLDYLLQQLQSVLPEIPVIAVGTPRPVQGQLHWVQEDPPGGGPVAGLSAGLAALPVGRTQEDQWFILLAGDLPFAALAVPALLGATPQEFTALVALDDSHRQQPLLACYHRAAVQRELTSTKTSAMAMFALLRQLRVAAVAVPPQACWDIDTPEDLQRARSVIDSSTKSL